MLLQGVTVLERYAHGSQKATIHVGIGDAGGLRERRLSLSKKDSSGALKSVTRYVATRSLEEIDLWRRELAIGADASAPLKGQTIVVEDAAPDTCLALITLAKRLSDEGIPETWLDYVDRWEQGYVDTTGEPKCSYGALLSALVHPEMQQTGSIVGALTVGIDYTAGLIKLGLDPSCLPRVLRSDSEALHRLHGNAHSRLAQEEIVFRRVLESATKVQLAVHLVGSRRRALVDAVLFSEIEWTSTLKNFLRSDQRSFTGRGYELQALYRPSLEGTGNDLTVSTDPAANLSLKALWVELERTEEERWAEFAKSPGGFARPRDETRNRVLPSHRDAPTPIAPCHQPWYEEMGKASIVAAPRYVEAEGRRIPGSRLNWTDVKAAVWKCYSPVNGLRLKSRGTAGKGVKLTDATSENGYLRRELSSASGLHIVDAVRADHVEDDVVVWCPSASAACAAFVETGSATIDKLPPTTAFDQIEERGGMVFVTENGVMILTLAGDQSFPADDLARAAADVGLTVACAVELEGAIRSQIRDLVQVAVSSGGDDKRRRALKEIYAAKLRGRTIWDHARRAETDDLVRRFRTLCEERWGARQRLDAALAEIGELESMVVSSSEVSANALINRLAIYGLPFSVAGNLLGGLLQFDNGQYKGVSIHVLIVYLLLTAAGIVGLRFVSGVVRRNWRLKNQDRTRN